MLLVWAGGMGFQVSHLLILRLWKVDSRKLDHRDRCGKNDILIMQQLFNIIVGGGMRYKCHLVFTGFRSFVVSLTLGAKHESFLPLPLFFFIFFWDLYKIYSRLWDTQRRVLPTKDLPRLNTRCEWATPLCVNPNSRCQWLPGPGIYTRQLRLLGFHYTATDSLSYI